MNGFNEENNNGNATKRKGRWNSQLRGRKTPTTKTYHGLSIGSLKGCGYDYSNSEIGDGDSTCLPAIHAKMIPT